MTGAIVKSILKETIENLPAETVMKPESVIPTFLKKGVKQEELEFSQFAVPEGTDLKGRVTKEDLQLAESQRTDWFKVADVNPLYSHINLPAGRNNPTYREKVYQFGNEAFVDSRYTSSHYTEVPNYLAHTRTYDNTFNGYDSRVVMEIQSDLHQQGRQVGYEGAVPASPYEKTWLKKTIEKELVSAVNDGKQQVMIPISGSSIRGQLFRAEGVQKWYETTVVDTARKIAKQTNSDFELITEGRKVEPKLPSFLIGMPDDTAVEVAVDFAGDYASDLVVNNDFDAIGEMLTELGTPAVNVTRVLDSLRASIDDEDMLSTTHDMLVELTELRTKRFLTAESNDITYAVIRPRTSQVSAVSEEAVQADIAKWNQVNQAVVKGEPGAKEAKATLDKEIADKYGIGGGTALKNTPLEQLTVKTTSGPAKPITVSLYAAPSAIVFATYNALQQGKSEEEVAAYLESKGYGYDEIAPWVQRLQQAEASGVPTQETLAYIDQRAQAIEPIQTQNDPAKLAAMADVEQDLRAVRQTHDNPELESKIFNKYGMSPQEFKMTAETNPASLSFTNGTNTPKDKSLDALIHPETFEDVRTLVGHMEIIKPTMSSIMMTDIPAWFGNERAAQRYQAATQQSQLAIQTLAQEKFGIQLMFDEQRGKWMAAGDDGQMHDVNPTFWEGIKNTKGELIGGTAGAIAGTIAGARTGAAMTGPLASVLGEYTVPIAAFSGGVTGGIIGAMAGTEFDYLYSAMQLNEDMQAEVAAHKALSSAELAVIGEAIGYPIAKGLGLGWRGLVAAKDMVFQGNSQGAYRALKEVSFLDDSQIEEIVQGLEKLAPLEGNKAQKAVQAVVQTQPGMQEVVRAAANVDPQAARAVIKSTSDRATALLDMTTNLTDPQVSRRFVEDLNNYTSDVKQFYNTVKQKAVNSPNAQAFQFDFDELAITPVLESIQERITDPTVAQRFLQQATRIRNMSESRDFGDLIELRQLVNDFLYNKNIKKADAKNMLMGLRNNIDAAIEDGAMSIMAKPQEWLDEWATARTQYSAMKKVEQTALYRLIYDRKGNLKPVDPASVTKAMAKYITSLDGSFNEMMTKLPIKGRAIYEGAVVNELANKYTVGVKGGMQAVNFPMLADDLAKVNLTTPDARAAKNAITELSEVFKNDVYLAQATGQMSIPKFQSYLTADPVVRAKFEIASGVFNTVKTWVPGQAQRNAALIRQTSKLLEKPLDVKAASELQAEFATQPEVLKAIKALQQNAATMAARDQNPITPMIKVFEGGKLKGTNQTATIPAHRIATLEQVRQIADAEALTMDSSKILDQVLQKYGYKAVMQGTDRVRILGAK